MGFFYSRFWKSIKNNKLLYGIIHRTIGTWVSQLHLKKRIRKMKINGNKVIKDLHALLSTQDTVFFVDFGTLLGFVREGKPIDWDYDIDFGICLSDKYTWNNLKTAMEAKGYSLVHEFQYCGMVTEQTYLCEGINVDFFAHFAFDNYSEYYVYYREKNAEYIDKTYMSARKSRTVLINSHIKHKVQMGIVNVPNDYEKYLEEVYGTDWRTPIKDFEARFESRKYPANRTVLPEYGRLVEY